MCKGTGTVGRDSGVTKGKYSVDSWTNQGTKSQNHFQSQATADLELFVSSPFWPLSSNPVQRPVFTLQSCSQVPSQTCSKTVNSIVTFYCEAQTDVLCYKSLSAIVKQQGLYTLGAARRDQSHNFASSCPLILSTI